MEIFRLVERFIQVVKIEFELVRRSNRVERQIACVIASEVKCWISGTRPHRRKLGRLGLSWGMLCTRHAPVPILNNDATRNPLCNSDLCGLCVQGYVHLIFPSNLGQRMSKQGSQVARVINVILTPRIFTACNWPTRAY